MWEIAKFTSHKQGFMRRTISFVIATLLAIVFVFLFNTQPASAADASWTNANSIVYNDNTYNGPAPETTNQALGLDESSQSYIYVEPPAERNSTEERKIHIIYFGPDIDVTTSVTAKYKNYTYINASDFENPSSEKTVSIDTAQATTSPQTSSCDGGAIGHGMGWIICPVTNFLANGMDFAYKTLSDFLFVRPASNDQNSALYRAWSYMRNIANIAFVIAFLVVIYSQLTTLGVSNYGIKRLLPRLIIAAILVNLSYYICAVAIDISNILGYSLQDTFLWIRNGLVGTTGNSWDVISWSSITGVILSGGTAAAAGTVGAITLFTTLSAYGVAGSLFLLLPSLLSGLMAIIVALVVIAGRQALITILAIISPLAFVAYLLPNTEKLFEKWKSTFLTLLVLFPAFSVIFGGAQLAGTAIIQNANSFNAIILGMLVQVFPLFITPMLIKLSGSALSGLANIVNNPSKGFIDRTRKFTEDRAENIKAARLGNKNPYRRRDALIRSAQKLDHKRREREYNRATNNATADARWYNSRSYRDIDQRMREATENKSIGEAKSEVRYLGSAPHRTLHKQSYELGLDKQIAEQSVEYSLNETIRSDGGLLAKEVSVRKAIDLTKSSKDKIDKILEEARSGSNITGFVELDNIAAEYRLVSRDLALTAIATQRAKLNQQTQLADDLLKNVDTIEGQSLRAYAAGIDTERGQEAALAYAVAVRRESDAKVINERSQLIKQFNLSGAERQSLAVGKEKDSATGALVDIASVNKSYQMADGTVVNYDFDVKDEFMREAAIETQMAIGSFDDIRTLVEMSGGELKKYITTISDGVAKNKVGERGLFLGGKTIDDISRGLITSHEDLIEITAKFIRDGKAKPEELARNDAEAIAVFIEAAQRGSMFMRSSEDIDKFNKGLTNLKSTADKILKSELLSKNATDAAREQLDILRNL